MDLPRDLLTFGVNILTARHQDRDFGLAVAWLTRCAEDELIALIGQHSATGAAIVASRRTVVHVLGEGQQPLGRRFGLASSLEVDKFAGLCINRDPHGVPVIPGCRRALSCALADQQEREGDHLLFLRVENLLERRDALPPLLMRSAEYQ